MDAHGRINRLLRVIQFTYLSALASFINYLVLYLNDIGFSELYIGVIHAVGAGMMLIIQMVLGKILDRKQCFRQVVAAVLGFCILGVAAMPFVKSWLFLELVIIILLYAIIKQFGNVFDLWTYQLKTEYPEVTYGSTRGIGSIGEGVATFALGYLIAWFGFGAMFAVTVVLLALALLAAMQMPNPARQQAADTEDKNWRAVLNRQLVLYLISFLVMKIAVTLISTFCSLMVQRLGGGSEWYGFIILLCGITELPVFIWLGRSCKGPKAQLWYKLCILIGLTGSVMDALAPNIPIFVVGRVLLTVVYVIYTVANLEYVRTYVSPAYQGQVMLLIGAVSSSIGYMASSLLGGYLLELDDQVVMAVVMALLFAVSWILHSIAFHAYAFHKRRNG